MTGNLNPAKPIQVTKQTNKNSLDFLRIYQITEKIQSSEG